ncbi:MAG: hypothetical protein JSU86_20270 [Phycisphaerales bacterium]|nr:MAG: hypothetical protein JSU86_20270 [Phycisphaerales bacterium]
MKKLFAMIKKLPPEARMLLALAGLGTPFGAIYLLRRFFPGVSMFMLILCVAGVLLGVALIIWLISMIFTRGRKKRTRRMAAELADEAQAGPQSVDVSAAIKANNEKFFSAIRDMRKNVGISVYDLPWYIVLGDSGCGKTKLVNEGGLTFSTGKPEGYQLGTLNYNWWFTEDAIFVDMAGRLCNPQDDSDRREWSAFLDAVAKGRKGFPINGALVCVSADHLLQDPPEKIEADANTTLERLRDLQTKLGVTFATYLVVTKCDKILGFMHSFDRAERDITVKNQIFGWSKPGDFNKLYDPEQFKEDFEAVYVRLNELRLRRLNDDAEEIDLGLAYSFPEEFRGLYEPLQIYVRTLFPFIRQPRAVKNLIFRGVYFTSATQEGELILKHLTERLGAEAADQFAPLDDLYPNKRPHFIKDVLFRKVFPEHGLVFRNEQQVIRNKQLSRVLKIGTGVLAVVLITAFGLSISAFERVIGEPRENAGETAKSFRTMSSTGALQRAGVIETDVNKLRGSRLAAWILTWGVGADQPIDDLERLRLALVEKSVLTALREVDEAIGSATDLQQPATPAAKAYMDALEQYLIWFGCRGEAEPPRQITLDGFETLCGVQTDSQSITRQEGFQKQTRWYFAAIEEDDRRAKNPASLLAAADLDPDQTISDALDSVYEHYRRHYATLGTEHANRQIAEWMRIRGQCLAVKDHYKAMLSAAAQVERVETLIELDEFREAFQEHYRAFDRALNGATWQGEGTGTMLRTIPPLGDLLAHQREHWLDYQTRLRAAALTCGVEDRKILGAIDALSAGDQVRKEGLDRAFWNNLYGLGIVAAPYNETVYDEDRFKELVSEVHESFPHILSLTRGDGQTRNDELHSTADAQKVRDVLREIHDNLAGMNTTVPRDLSGETAAGWIDALAKHVDAFEQERDGIDVTGLSSFWEPPALSELYLGCGDVVHLGEGTRLLKTILARLDEVKQTSAWGFAELAPLEQRTTEERSPYTIQAAGRPSSRRRPEAEPTRPEPKKRKSRRLRRGTEEPPGERPGRGERTSPATELRAPQTRGAGRVRAYATHRFLNERAYDLAELLVFLEDVRDSFLDEGDQVEPLNERCVAKVEESARAYMETYVSEWAIAYRSKKLEALDQLTSRASGWEQLASNLSPASRGWGSSPLDIADEFEQALLWILRALPWATYHPDDRDWWAEYDDPRGARQFAQLAAWMSESIGRAWDARELGGFVFTSKRVSTPDPSQYPWETIAGEFRGSWVALARGIASNAGLPTNFRGELDWTGTPIPWGRLKVLRYQHGLTDEKLTGQLFEFEQDARDLLSARLTEILWGVQERHLGDQQPFEGWPYLPGEDYAPTGLDAVDFDHFIGFLVEMHRAKTLFESLEAGLADEAPGWGSRDEFYRSCEAWFDFLELKDEPKPSPEPLHLTILSDDPVVHPYGKERVDETCQHTAVSFMLDLGLRVVQRGAVSTPSALNIACESQYRQPGGYRAEWHWDDTSRKELRVRLEGIRSRFKDPGPKALGMYSPLALCAYLHRYGNGREQNKTWYVTHGFERQARDAPTQTVGDMLVFKLRRPLPEPITRLPKAPASSRRPK